MERGIMEVWIIAGAFFVGFLALFSVKSLPLLLPVLCARRKGQKLGALFAPHL
jgi:hypothetical protein